VPSIVDICNLALSQIGATERIGSLTEGSKASKACALTYEHSRDAALSATDWPFCLRRATLALIEAAPSPEWAYRYALPKDCVTCRYIETTIRRSMVPHDQQIPFQLESSEDGLFVTLMTDLPDAVLAYTTNLQGVGTWPPMFTRLVVKVLASDLAMAMTTDRNIRSDAEKIAYMALLSARAVVFNERTPDPDQDPETIQARL